MYNNNQSQTGKRSDKGASGKCFGPAVVPLVHCRAFLYSGKQAFRLCWRLHSGGCCAQGRLTVNYRYTHRKFQLKFSALLKDYDLKYAENSKK